MTALSVRHGFMATIGACALGALWMSVAAGQGADHLRSSSGAIDQTHTTSIDRSADPRSDLLEKKRLSEMQRLEAVRRNVSVSREALAEIEAQIEDLRSDAQKTQEAMIEAAAAQRRTGARLSIIEDRMSTLAAETGRIEVSLIERRDVLAEVLAALQRLGRKPPPALFVKPSDALGAVRSAILLGAVVPAVRSETETLLADLTALSRLHEEAEAEEKRFVAAMATYREEEARLTRLREEKSRLLAATEERRDGAAQRAASFAEEAESLEALIGNLKRDVEAARKAERLAAAERAREVAARMREEIEQQRERAEQARLAEAAKELEAERAQTLATEEDTSEAAERETASDEPGTEPAKLDEASNVRVAALPSDEGATSTERKTGYDRASLRRAAPRIGGSAAFSSMKGRLPVPVIGNEILGFGDTDDIGRQVNGTSFRARSGEVVVAPAEGEVLYAGPFRSYGQVLILDVGEDYHLVLAGMERIDVGTGQFVSPGEPIAMMGSARVASIAQAEFGALEPVLYVELRKAGRPLDPSPWWIDEAPGRTRNGA